jgi:DNA-binding GntR family transcriptional regulator
MSHPVAAPLLKEQLAASLKEAIVQGRLLPGQRVVEGKWAREFGAAQASVREAINLLIADGFLVKDSGRSARVVRYRDEDVVRIYEVRGALEGLAAQLATARQADLTALDGALHRMGTAVKRGNMKALIEADLDFHLALAGAGGNPLLAEMLRRVLSPLFAFVLLSVLKSRQGPDAWSGDLPRHRRIVEMIREGNPQLALGYVQHCVGCFAASAYRVWENAGGSVEAHTRGKSRRTKRGTK